MKEVCLRVIVLGAGGIGAGLGGLLATIGIDVVLVARGAHGRALQRDGLTLRTPTSRHRLALPVYEQVTQIDWRSDDVVLVTVKLGDAEEAYRDLAAVVPPDQPVVMGQNGMVASEWARAAGLRHIIDSMIWVPAQRLVPGVVDLHATPIPGAVDLSEDAGLAAPLRRAGFRCTVRDDLDAWRRAKWLTNLCGAAVVFDRQDWIPELMQEGRQVLEAAGRPTVSHEELLAYVGDIGLDTIEGEERLPGGSTMQSARLGKPLETRWLNGPLVTLAEAHGVEVPRNRALLELATA